MEAQLRQQSVTSIDLTAAAAYSAGEVIQLADGRAAVVPVDIASGARGNASATGIYRLPKTASIALLAGGRVFWDHSENKAHFKKVNDRDFYVGRVAWDAAESDSYVFVELNVDPPYDIDLLRHGCLSVPTGTKAVGAFGFPKVLGGSAELELTATNEAQCIDMLSVDRFSVDAPAIAEFIVRPNANGSGSACDINFGLANGTSATDADAITESVFFHIDGGSTAINAESDDGTTENAAADTTKTISAGSAVANRVEFWIDKRDKTNIKLYVDGVRVLPNTTFTLAAATGPIGLLAHLEKTSGTETAKFTVDAARARLMQQASAA